MNSSEVPAPLRQSYENLVCDVCDVKFESPKSLDIHYCEREHTDRAEDLAKCLFGYQPDTRITCLDDLFNHPKKKGVYIGMHYLKGCNKGEKTMPVCSLCNVACTTMFEHIDSINHKKNYIDRHFRFMFKDDKSVPLKLIESVAAVIEQVEGPQKFKEAIKNPTKSFSASVCAFMHTLDKVVEKLKKRGIACENPYNPPNESNNLMLIKATPSKPSAAAQNTSMQGKKIIEKRQNLGIDCKDNCRKEKVVSCQPVGSHASATKEQNNKTTSVAPKSSASSNITVQQVVDKRQNHGVDSKDTCRNEKVMSCQQAGLHASGTNEQNNITTSVPQKSPAASNITSKQVDDEIGKRQCHAADSKDTCQNKKVMSCQQARSHASGTNEKKNTTTSVPQKSPAALNITTKQVDDKVDKQQNHSVDGKDTCQNGKVLSCQQTGLHASGTNEKKSITTSVPQKSPAASNITTKQVDDEIDKRHNHGVDSKDTCQKEKVLSYQQAGLHASGINEKKNINASVPRKSPAASNITTKQVEDEIDKRQNHKVVSKDTCQKEKVVSYQQAGSHASGTNEKKNINASVPWKSPAASDITSKQVDDKQKNHRVVSKDTCRNVNAVPSLQTGTRASAINEKSVKRPLQFKPFEAFKRSKYELASQRVGKPITSLCRPVPVPFSFPVPSGGVIGGNNMPGYNNLPTKLPTTSYLPPENHSFEPKPIPSFWSSHNRSWVHQTNPPPAEFHFPSWPPPVPFHQSAVQGYGYSDQRFCGFANESAYGQASSVPDVGKASAFKDNWWQETGHLGAQHLHTLGTMDGSVSSFTGPTSSVVSLKQDSPSSYNHISVDSKELFSKSYSQPEVISVLSKEPSLPKSYQDSPPFEGLPPATPRTGSRAQTSQSTNSDMLDKAASVLSPDTLKVLKGRDPDSVKSILKRLSEYCPELKETNISLLVDVLFETGALH